ncbi:MAG: alpha-amylase family glycosyl hydrolase [Phycisphaerales bacterium]|nr:alpha-amylase family glycosyl hydrolase [Phycisphaerales bacterium]
MSSFCCHNLVLYEVNVRQYSNEGTFIAFSDHLDRLADMGVNAIWLMPITPISQVNKKGILGSYYACSSYTTINPEFGSLDDLLFLINKAHQLNIKVLIDWVANHTGYEHDWIQYPHFYIKNEAEQFYDKNGWEDVIDLDYSCLAMQDKMIEAMSYWVNKADIDGFRCDMAHLVPLNFWQKARTELDKIKQLIWLAECDDIKYHQVFDMSYAWSWNNEVKKHIQVNNIGHLKLFLQHTITTGNDVQKLYFTSNHDENSWNGTEYECFGTLVPVLTIWSFLGAGVPLIYSGQELPNLKRLPFFSKDPLSWNTPCTLSGFYKQLADLRMLLALQPIEFIWLENDSPCVAFIRQSGSKHLLVFLNFSIHEVARFNLNHPALSGTYKNVSTGITYTFNESEKFELLPAEYALYIMTL